LDAKAIEKSINRKVNSLGWYVQVKYLSDDEWSVILYQCRKNCVAKKSKDKDAKKFVEDLVMDMAGLTISRRGRPPGAGKRIGPRLPDTG